MELTQQEKNMIAMMRQSSKKEQGGNTNKEAMGNLYSMIEAAISVGADSSIPKVRQRSMELSNKDLTTLNRAEINGILAEIDTASKVDTTFDSIMPSLITAVDMVKAEKTDEQIKEDMKEEFDEQRNSVNEDEEVILVNEATGSRFIKHSDGSISPYISPDEEYEENSATLDEQFIASGGEQAPSMFEGLRDV